MSPSTRRGYACILNKEAARASEKAKEEDEKVCIKHCWWHSSAACREDDVFISRTDVSKPS